MCHAILKISYRSTAQPAYLEVEQAEQLEEKLDEVRNRPEVQSITVFNRHASHKLVPTWTVDTHE